MSFEDQSGEAIYEVVINIEDQYSIWPADKPIPDGWRAAGKRDTKAACLDFIRANWTDMTPRSVKQQMQPASH